MPFSRTLETQVYVRLRESFGKPRKAGSHNRRWSVHPSRHAPTINITLDCAGPFLKVWVFDPNHRALGIVSQEITSGHQIELLIGQIRRQVQGAAGRMSAGCGDQGQREAG